MKDARVTIRLTEQEKETFSKKAQERDIPLSQLIREAIRQYIRED